jgi:hypothetical protein
MVNEIGKSPHVRRVFLNIVPYHGIGERFNEAGHVVETRDQGVNVLAVDRSNKRLFDTNGGHGFSPWKRLGC